MDCCEMGSEVGWSLSTMVSPLIFVERSATKHDSCAQDTLRTPFAMHDLITTLVHNGRFW